RFGEMGYVIGGGTPSKSNPRLWNGSIPWVSPKDMKSDYIVDSQDHIAIDALYKSPVKLIPESSLLMVVRGMILAHSFPTALTKTEVTINQDMKALCSYVEGMQEYLLTCTRGMKSKFLSLVEYSTHGTCRIDSEKLLMSVVALPPKQEQERILRRVDILMIMCDELEKRVEDTRACQIKLLDALVHTRSKGNAEKNPRNASIPKAQIIDLAAYRASIGCYTLSKLANAQYFGRTAAAKVMYLAQAHIGLDLNMKPEREAAGPLDPWIYDFERQGQRRGWFEVNEKALANGKKKTEYRCLSALSGPAANAETLMTSGQKAEFDRLLYALADKKTEEVEIVATLFAVWNDFLIDGVRPTDAQIISELRENWHERKARFTPAELGRWLHWLRKEGIVPRGLSPKTVRQSQLALH
ncbi:restriction endonuclease subunit S, partial [Achromobacter xylosoxidans]